MRAGLRTRAVCRRGVLVALLFFGVFSPICEGDSHGAKSIRMTSSGTELAVRFRTSTSRRCCGYTTRQQRQ